MGTLPNSSHQLVLPSTTSAPVGGQVKVTFHGTSTLLFDDGETEDVMRSIATQIQTLADARKRRPTAANRAHPDAEEDQEESNHAEPQ